MGQIDRAGNHCPSGMSLLETRLPTTLDVGELEERRRSRWALYITYEPCLCEDGGSDPAQ